MTNRFRLWSCPPLRSPSLASNASRRGRFQTSLNHSTTLPPPSFQMRVGGGCFHHTTTLLPSLASNASRRGRFHHTTTFLPSLASNASRRGVFQVSPHHRLSPLPHFKCKSEGGVFTTPPPFSPPSLQMRVGGVVCSFDPVTTRSPSLLQMRVGEGVLRLHPPQYHPSPSLAVNASQRGHFQSSSP